MEKRKVLIWLDDMRDPSTRYENTIYTYSEYFTCSGMGCPIIKWIKDYDSFVKEIEENGLPFEIAFDHDLGEGKSGFDCAKWLVEYCMDHNVEPPICVSQSSNPIGKDNILNLIANFRDKYFR